MGYYVEKPFRIPATARDFEGFRRWTRSPRFPDWLRIDYIAGDLELDMGIESFRIPAQAWDFEGFRRWTRSRQFPQRGRIDYVGGALEVDMSPEEAYTHSAVKVEIAVKLHARIVAPDIGAIHIDSMRSPLLGPVRLRRERKRPDRWSYRLDVGQS